MNARPSAPRARCDSGITLVEIVVALTLASVGIVATASTLVKCTSLQTATRKATEDRELTREVFVKLRGSGWQAEFDAMHTRASQPSTSTSRYPTSTEASRTNTTSLAGDRSQAVEFPSSELSTLLRTAPAATARFVDTNADGIVDRNATSTEAGLLPVRVTIARTGRSVSYFSLVRIP